MPGSPLTAAPSTTPPIRVAVVDSGVGGLSVVPALQQLLPQAELRVVADSAHAPYGERDDAWLQARCDRLTGLVRQAGADLMVLACNTATAAAAEALRAQHPGFPIVGIEPGIKPARQLSRNGRIGVMATEATLRSQRFRKLMAEHGQGLEVRTRACVGLAWAIERGDEREIRDLVQQHTQPLRQAAVDVVVLGCTHYPFVRTLIQEAMGPQVQLLDTAEPVARQAARLLEPRMPTLGGALSREPGGVRFWTSGQPEKLEDFARRWLGWAIRAEPLPEPAGAPATAAAGPR